MAQQLQTNDSGEGVNGSSDIKVWMKQNNCSILSDDAYQKLKNEGFNTIDDLKDCTKEEMEKYAQGMKFKMRDQSKLNRLMETLLDSDKKNYVDAEEIAILKSMEIKLNGFKNSINRLTQKEKDINQTKQTLETEINNIFDILQNKVSKRKALLLQQLNDIINKKDVSIKAKINHYNKTLKEVEQLQSDTKTLINASIKIDELSDRKLKVIQYEKDMIKIINDNNNKSDQIVINDKMRFIFDKNAAIQLISNFGRILESTIPILDRLEYDNNNPNGLLKVFWKLNKIDNDIDNDNKENDSSKISIGYGIINDDNKNNDIDEKELKSKEFSVDSKQNEGNECIEMDSIGLYLVKLRYYKNNVWSPYSNISSITINKLLPMSNSNILTDNEKVSLLQMISPQILKDNTNNKRLKLKLLYRMSRDGKQTSVFHSKCNNKGATISVVQSTFNHVFGGYASVSWTSAENYVKDENAFLYLIRSQFGHQKQIYNINKDKTGNALYDYSSDGPSFGSTCSLRIYSNCQSAYVQSDDTTYALKGTGNALCGGEQYNAKDTGYSFPVEDYEVFEIIV